MYARIRDRNTSVHALISSKDDQRSLIPIRRPNSIQNTKNAYHKFNLSITGYRPWEMKDKLVALLLYADATQSVLSNPKGKGHEWSFEEHSKHSLCIRQEHLRWVQVWITPDCTWSHRFPANIFRALFRQLINNTRDLQLDTCCATSSLWQWQ